MGQKQSVHHEIDIDRPIEAVRDIFLDFTSYPDWFEYWTLEPDDSGKPTKELTRGDKLVCVYRGGGLGCVVVANSSKSFQIRGGTRGLLMGHHQVYFEPSKVLKGGTKLTVHEDFTGLLAFMARRGADMRTDLDFTFANFNENLKKKAEGTIS